MKLKLFAVETRDGTTMLVPAEMASAAPEPSKVKQVSVGGKVSPDLAAQFRAAASRAGANVSALIGQLIATYVATHA